MPIAESAPNLCIDLIEELRLRRWARENYCYWDARQPSWHPVIHDEMRRIDVDSLREEATSVFSDEDLDQIPGDSTILTDEDIEAAQTTRPLPLGLIVPLAADLADLHGPHEITPPHTRIAAPADKAEMHYT
jgi:hypothetical protein